MIIDSISSMSETSNSISSLKFVLYLKNKEISELSKVLNRVMLLSKKEQQVWKKEYGEMADRALDLFVNESNLVLKRLSMDEEVLELSHQLVTSLQDVLRSADAVLGAKTYLDS